MTGALSGRAILLTGGGSGIGRAVALAYAGQGATVTLLERSADNAEQLRRADDRLRVLVGDATDPSVVEEAVAAAAEPTGQLDNLTCTVGVFDFYASLKELSADDLPRAAEEVWRVNVLSVLIAARAAYPRLRASRGSVTLTLSESAFHPVGGGVLYGSAKWALRGVVAHLAKDFAPEVRVNGVAPGGTTGTRFGGLRSLGQTRTADQVEGRDERIAASNLLGVTPRPEDHTAAYVYLADPVAARVVTGVVVPTDGGRRM